MINDEKSHSTMDFGRCDENNLNYLFQGHLLQIQILLHSSEVVPLSRNCFIFLEILESVAPIFLKVYFIL